MYQAVTAVSFVGVVAAVRITTTAETKRMFLLTEDLSYVKSVLYNMNYSPREYFLKKISDDKFNLWIVHFTSLM